MRRNIHINGNKKCPTCGEWKPATIEYFTVKKSRWDGLSPQCKGCMKKYSTKNKDRIKENSHKRYNEKKDHIKAINLEWKKANGDKYKAIMSKYRAGETGRKTRCRLQQKRDAIKSNLQCGFTSGQWDSAVDFFNHRCAYCGKEKTLTQDHFIPLSGGGEYTINNIIPACLSCNTKKSTKDFFDWYGKQSFYSSLRENKILKYLNYKGDNQQLALL